MGIPITTHIASFSRLNPDVSDTDKEAYVDISGLEAVSVNVQPASPEPSELATGVFDKRHIMFASVTLSGIREGYRTTISGLYDGEYNRVMTIIGVEDWSKGPGPNHFQFTLSELID